MAVRFVIGRAGTGKTAWCFERIVQSIRRQPLGAPIYWILPRQATFVAERALACGSGLGGYFRARVLSFEDLGSEILAECGGAALPEITDRGRRMILGHLLRRLHEQLRFFRSVAHHPGVAAELDATFAELERAGQEAVGIERQLTDTAASPALHAKIHDLALIYSHYVKFLGQDRIDPNRRLAEALAAIGRCRSLPQAEVFIDSFYDFTGSERKVIAALGKVCKSASITLMLDPGSPCIANPHHVPDEMSPFHRCEQAYRKLWFTLQEEGVEVLEPALLKQPRRFKGRRLAMLERLFFPSPGLGAKGPDEPDDRTIQLVEAPDYQAEVDAVARWIRMLVAGGMRYRDVVVLMRSQQDYQHFLEASFHEHNVPFFADRRRSASHHPLLRLIRAVLAVATSNWSHDSMMAVIKTGLVGLTESDADALENYVLLHGIDHGTWISPQPWTGRRARGEESDAVWVDDAPAMDALRRGLMDRLQPFVQSTAARQGTSVASLASAIFRLLEDFHCRDQIVQWMDRAADAGELEERGEHERVWDELVKLFDELVDLFGDEPISLEDFSAILDSALEGFDLALTPPTVDQVLVGVVDRTRAPATKACAVLGLAEGQFPRASLEDSIFTDADRRTLGRHNIDLDPDTSRRLLDEHFLGYVALTRASERLLLTRSAADEDGRPVGASPLWQRVVEIMPDVPLARLPHEEMLPLRHVATPRQLVGSLMRWVRDGAAEPQWEPVYQWLATHSPCDDAIDVARFRAWKALSYGNEARLEAGRAAEMFPSPLHASIFQLESFRMCPYQHFARYGLGLEQRERRQLDRGDLSRVFHEVLQRLVKELTASRQTWQDMDDAQARQRLSRLTAQLGQQLRDDLMLSKARNRYLLGHIEKTLGLIAASQKAAAQRGGFRPAFINVRFGSNPADSLGPLAIRTPAGNQTLIHGKIDRIDLLGDGSACALDYRLSADPPDAGSAYHGLSLQLLSYLLVLEQHGRHLTEEGELAPAAAFFIKLLRPVRPADPQNAPAPDDPRFHLLVKPRGIFDLRVARELDRSLTDGNSEVVQLFLKKDGSVGRANQSDAAGSTEFAALLRHVERRIGELADQIMAGRIDIRPYRMGKQTPCPRCEFRSLCRLEPSPGCYDDLEGMNREEMFERLMRRKE